MSKADDYRQNAAETVELANKAATTGDKGRLLRLAQKWIDLADRAHRLTRRSRRPSPEHPLVTKRLGSDRSEAE